MENASTEVSLLSDSSIIKEGAGHQPVLLFAQYNMDADKPVTVENLLPMGFIGGPTRQ